MKRMPGVDHQRVRRLARQQRDAGCANATEAGRQMARELGEAYKNGDSTVWPTILGLLSNACATYYRHVAKEGSITVKRRGQVVTVSGGYAVPGFMSAPKVANTESQDDESAVRSLYIQWDMMTWNQFFALRDRLTDRSGALGSLVVTFQEIERLHEIYPDLTVGGAMQAAGFDLASRSLDLDVLREVV